MLDTIAIVRISTDTLLVNGMVVMYDDNLGFWKTVSGARLSGIQYEKIYTFLDEERLMLRERFNKYVDNIIKNILG